MKKIAVVPNFYKDADMSCTTRVLDYVLESDCTIYISDEYSQQLCKYKNNE